MKKSFQGKRRIETKTLDCGCWKSIHALDSLEGHETRETESMFCLCWDTVKTRSETLLVSRHFIIITAALWWKKENNFYVWGEIFYYLFWYFVFESKIFYVLTARSYENSWVGWHCFTFFEYICARFSLFLVESIILINSWM